MAKHTELALAGLVATGRKLAAGELSSVALTEAMLERIGELDGVLHSYATMMADQALAEAKQAESELAAGNSRGALHGVPIAVKDLCDATGVPTMAGFPGFEDRVARSDSTVVRRLRDAGAVLLGKLQLTEGAFALHHPDVVAPVNPWGAELWSGASSSGSGAATAAGLCFGSLGSDTGGSIRFPCYANHLIGLKPTWGRVSAMAFPLTDTRTTSVYDPARRGAAACWARRRRDELDPPAVRAVPDYLASIDDGVAGLRIGYDERYCSEGVDTQVFQAITRGLDLLKGRGASVVPVTLPDTREAVAHWGALCAVEAALAHGPTYPERKRDYSVGYAEFLDGGLALSGVDYARATIVRHEFSGAMAALFASVDLYIAPIMCKPVPTAAEFVALCAEPDGVPRIVQYTSPEDLTGCPALILPGGLDASGAPVGFQLVGRHLEEGRLFQAGKAYQADADWPALAPLAA